MIALGVEHRCIEDKADPEKKNDGQPVHEPFYDYSRNSGALAHILSLPEKDRPDQFPQPEWYNPGYHIADDRRRKQVVKADPFLYRSEQQTPAEASKYVLAQSDRDRQHKKWQIGNPYPCPNLIEIGVPKEDTEKNDRNEQTDDYFEILFQKPSIHFSLITYINACFESTFSGYFLDFYQNHQSFSN
jgi:hypothetical protein